MTTSAPSWQKQRGLQSLVSSQNNPMRIASTSRLSTRHPACTCLTSKGSIITSMRHVPARRSTPVSTTCAQPFPYCWTNIGVLIRSCPQKPQPWKDYGNLPRSCSPNLSQILHSLLLTSLHLTSLHVTSLHFLSPHFTSLPLFHGLQCANV